MCVFVCVWVCVCVCVCVHVWLIDLCRARRIVENAFGILTARWRLFRQPIIAKPENVEVFVKATVALHNFLQTENRPTYCPSGFVDCDNNGRLTEGSWRIGLEDGGLTPISRSASNNYTNKAKDLRDKLAQYFVSPTGAVSWQANSVSEIQ